MWMVWTMATARVLRNWVTNDREILTSSIQANVDQILKNLTQQVIALPVATPPKFQSLFTYTHKNINIV